MITFYDIHSTVSKKAWNNSPWKVRYILNYKGLPYKTEFVEYPDIEAVSKKLGLQPTGTKLDGSPLYTLPAIYDSTTGKALADSFPIAQYLDATYPDTPKVVVEGSEILTVGFVDTFTTKFYALYIYLLPQMCAIHTPRSQEYIARRPYPKPFEELMVVSEEGKKDGLRMVKEAMGQVDGWFKNAGWDKKFIMGDKPTFADFAVAGPFISLRLLLGEDSKEWKEIVTWNNGRWAKHLEALKEWEVII
ncbi:hypothetical protein BDQ17DRAFT_1310307 [Cyathus striatus]|nr:hypothetical protein BDQ17DRAFT_1310307 [Cyathus striatus]